MFDQGRSSAIGAIAIAPSNRNIIYIGGGQPEPRYDVQSGRGVYKSVDGGRTWADLGLADTRYIGRIWVSPTEVEAVINSHEAVLECAVVGIVDEERLIRPEAYVVLQPGRTETVELEVELRDYVRSRLAHFKCPRDFRFVESLPKTATGKIQRFKLRA